MYPAVPPLLFRPPNFYAKHRVFFIPYAGAGASISEPYYPLLQPDIDLIALQLPGRENRIEEEPFSDMASVTQLAQELLPFLDMPFSFWGHCSGALIAYELAKKIKSMVKIEPQHLLISACATPEDAASVLPRTYHTLEDVDLIDAIAELMGNAFDETEMQQSAVKILLPGIKADFTLYETYQPQKNMPLSCPLYCIGGAQDPMILEEHLQKWRNYTTGSFALKIFPQAHHYFINSHVNELAQELRGILL